MSGSAKVTCLCPEDEEQACCLPDDEGCVVMLPVDCLALGGTVPGQTTCEPDPCQAPPINCPIDCTACPETLGVKITGISLEDDFAFPLTVECTTSLTAAFTCEWENAFPDPPCGFGTALIRMLCNSALGWHIVVAVTNFTFTAQLRYCLGVAGDCPPTGVYPFCEVQLPAGWTLIAAGQVQML